MSHIVYRKSFVEQISRSNFIEIISFLIFLVSLLETRYSEYYLTLFSIFILLNNLSLLNKYWDIWELRIIALAIIYSNYSIIYFNLLSNNTSIFNSFILSQDSVVIVAYRILLLFSLLLSGFSKKVSPKSIGNIFYTRRNRNSIIVIVAIIALGFVFIYLFGRPEAADERGSPSTFYEYSIIVFIVAYYFSGDSKVLKLLLDVELFLFVLQVLVYGGRITALQLLFVYVSIRLIPKVSRKLIFLLLFFLMIIFSGIGMYRARFSLEYDLIKNIINQVLTTGFSLDTAFAASYASQTFILVKEISTVTQILTYFSNWVLSIFLGGALVSGSNLSTMSSQYYLHYGGGLLPFYFYYYFSYVGVGGVTFYLTYLINKVSRKNTDHNSILLVYISASSFRWYLYSPSAIFRGLLLIMIVYFLSNSFNRFVRYS